MSLNNKTETMLRAKVRLLEEQVQRLQSGMNIFAQLEEKTKEIPQTGRRECGHEQQLRSMSLKVTMLEHDKQRLLARQAQLEQ